MDRGPDTTLLQLLNHAIAIDPERCGLDAENIKVPGVFDIFRYRRKSKRIRTSKRSIVAIRDRRAARAQGVAFGELSETECGLQVR